VKEKWGAALLKAHGAVCKFRKSTNLGTAGKIKGWHIIEFQMA